jgi:hypothetical protein
MEKDMNETFEQFCERMNNVEKKEEFVVGQAHRGDTRAIYDFEGQICCLESFGYRTMPKNIKKPTPSQLFWTISGNEPTDRWVHCQLIYGPGHSGKKQERIKRIAKYYKAEFAEDPYPWEEGVWFYMYFDGEDNWERLMRLAWDRHTGKFLELWGDEAKEYKSCIGMELEQTPEELTKTI